MLKRTIDILFVAILVLLLAAPVAYHLAIRGDGRMTLDQFDPHTHLKVAEHPVERARYPVYAVGADLRGGVADATAAVASLMQGLNIETLVGSGGGGVTGKRLAAGLTRWRQDAAAVNVALAAGADLSGIDRPDFGDRLVRQLDEAFAAGARSLSISRDLGLGVRDGRGRLVRIDDPRLDPLWQHCGELGMPVIIESAAPSAYWRPVDPENERYRELQAQPIEGPGRWTTRGPALAAITGIQPKLKLMRDPESLRYFIFHWSGDFYPRKEELVLQRDAVVERHPGTTFIAVGVAGYPEDLAFVSRELESHPNLYVDLTGAYAELGRQPYRAREFLIEHADRVLFGVAGPPSAAAYRTAFRFLETRDEYFDPPAAAGRPQVGWKIYGMGLPDEVLRRIYQENARQLFGHA